MPIPTRTPEGDPNRCPICGNAIRVEPSIDTRDAPCPHCGHLLWFNSIDQQIASVAAEFVLSFGTVKFGPPSDEIKTAIRGLGTATGIETIADRLLAARSWEELLETE